MLFRSKPLLPGQEQEFDLAFAYQSLLYFDDYQMRDIIENMFRLLKPKGRVVISVRSTEDYKFKDNPNKTGPNRAIGPLNEDSLERRFFEEKGLRDLFAQGGFDNISIRMERIPRFGKMSTVYYLSAEKSGAVQSRAMTARVHGTGGIDLTANKTPLEVKTGSRTSEGISFKIDPAMLAQLQNAPGFMPVIINIQPLIDLKVFLGLVQAIDK